MAPDKTHCDLCGRKVTPRDFENGRALILLKKAWCKACADRMVEKEKELRAGKKDHTSRQVGVGAPAQREPAPARGSGLPAGAHVCTLYSTEAERALQVGRFLSEGLRAGEKVVYAVDEPTGDRVLGYLASMGMPSEPYLRSGQLEIHSTRNIYAPDGKFDPSQMIARIKMLSDQSTKEGYRGMRGSGEMTWALRGWPGSERLAEYEVRLSAALRGGPCLAFCQYDSSRFSPSLLRQMRAAHSIVYSKDIA